VLLVSVPYALKAADAETLGGKPASAFLQASPDQEDGTGTRPPKLPPTVHGNGTVNFLPLWTAKNIVDKSSVFQSGNNVGIGTTSPTALLDVAGTSSIRNTLSLFPNGSAPTLSVSGTAFSIGNTGLVNFVSGQTFPGIGTITGVTAGTDLTGGGTRGNVTLNLNTAATDARYAQLNANNAFTKTMSFAAGQTFPGTAQVNVANTFTQPQTINGVSSGLTASASDPSGVGLSGSGFIGVEAFSTNSNGVGVDAFGGSIGVAGSSSATGGFGVKGGTSNGTGVEGDDASGGFGVVGTSVTGIGVIGISNSERGVSGFSSSQPGVYGSSNSGYGVQGESSTFDGVNGVTNGSDVSGVAGINNTSGTGVYGLSSGGYGFKTPNHVAQDRGSSGWVKAMVFVDPFTPSGTAIIRCFNSQTSGPAASTPPCGFGINHLGQGKDVIDFGFQVNDRFISVAAPDLTLTCMQDPHDPGCNISVNQVLVATGTFGGSPIDIGFWLIVF
jgi:hypothetical protein